MPVCQMEILKAKIDEDERVRWAMPECSPVYVWESYPFASFFFAVLAKQGLAATHTHCSRKWRERDSPDAITNIVGPRFTGSGDSNRQVEGHVRSLPPDGHEVYTSIASTPSHRTAVIRNPFAIIRRSTAPVSHRRTTRQPSRQSIGITQALLEICLARLHL
jgi:hypothetical protein